MKNDRSIAPNKSITSKSFWIRLLMILVTAQACGPADGTLGGGKLGDGKTAKVQQLATPGEIGAVIQGKIVNAPVVTAGVALSTKGEAKVTDAGTLEYRVPIWVPDGVHGMQPSLAIVEDSAGGFGLLGKRWGLAGLSMIRRCQKTLAEDTKAAPIQFDGDEFCLDGERLIRTLGNANSTGEFRTRKNPYQKIVVSSAGLLNGVQAFEVYQPDGTIFYYGRTNASRLRGNFSWITGQRFAAYYLDKIQDRFGNSILFTYSPQTMMGPELNELVPTKIEWGGMGDAPGQRSVQFNYVGGATDGDAQHTHWMAGVAFRSGQRIESISISGPDGAGNVPLLKKYNFTYTAPSITHEQLLTTIAECDGFGACKRPTKINWERGTFGHVRHNLTGAGVDDVTIAGASADDRNRYRRIFVADLNQDGRDDIVYRAVIPATTPASGTCLSWKARLAQPSIGFGPPITIDVGHDSDARCWDSNTTLAPFRGDLVLADLNRDGYPDILSPAGRTDGKGVNNFPAPAQWAYRAYMNSALRGDTVAFGPRLEFEESSLVQSSDDYWCEYYGGSVAGYNPLVAVGDVDGDGYPDLLRPNYMTPLLWCTENFPPAGGLTGFSLNQAGGGSSAPVTVVKKTLLPGVSPPLAEVIGLATLDGDGDGVAEILWDFSVQSNVYTDVTSPTMNGQVSIASANPPPMGLLPSGGAPSTRWLLDLNGDGLRDVAAVYSSDTSTIVTSISTGKGFTATHSTTLPPGTRIGQAWRDGYDNGARVVDYNLDGRQDLVLMDNGYTLVSLIPPNVETRTHQVVLLSDGAGGFTIINPSEVPVGDAADGIVYQTSTRVAPGARGYRTSVVLDANGDGLPDLMQFEGGLALHVRQGKMPDLVTSIVEGTGRSMAATYAPATDSSMYTANPDACASDVDHLTCLVGGQWLVRSLGVSGCDGNISQTQTFTYAGGLFDRGGLGFLGFQQRDIVGPASNHVTKTFDNAKRRFTGSGFSTPFGIAYTYPEAFRPRYIQSDVDTPQGPNTHHLTLQGYTYTFEVQNQPNGKATFSVMPATVQTDAYDCPWGPGGCQEYRLLNSRYRTTNYDDFGNLTSDTTQYFDDSHSSIQTDSEVTTFLSDTTGTWLVRMPDQKQVTSATADPPLTVTRTTKFTPDLTTWPATNLPNGEIATMETEPTGKGPVRLLKTYGRDFRGRLTSVEEKAVASGETRTTGYQYEDAEGVYVTTTTDPKGFSTRVWRHIGFGFVVQTDDPNGVHATNSYDTLGRQLTERKLTGEFTRTSYNDPVTDTICGSESTLYPEGRLTRAIKVRGDAFGNETQRTSPVDSTRSLSVNTEYDELGRAQRTTMYSSSTPAPIAYDLVTYDDLNRVLSDCHVVTDGSLRCKTNKYDGATITSTSEASRTTTQKADALGRISKVSAELSTGISDATFIYGPFGLLRQERTYEGAAEISPIAGLTTQVYDVLGRQTSLTRTNAGTRGTVYDAFGSVVSTNKILDDGRLGKPTEIVSYGRDALGRLTSITGPTINRTFSWDAAISNPTVFAPNAKGKLVDVTDGGSTQVHFDYGTNGFVSKKTWYASVWGPLTEVASVGYGYDAQGRIRTLTYPKVGIWSNPLVITHAYDPYVGELSSLTDSSNSGTPVWRVYSRDQRGTVNGELMQVQFGQEVYRANSYSPATGLLTSSYFDTLSAADTVTYAYASYNYDAAGFPSRIVSFGNGIDGIRTSTFGYDNLGRLTHWGPGQCCGGLDVGVDYTYDSDGNLTDRTWSSPGTGGTRRYGVTSNPDGSYTRSVTFIPARSGPSHTENYQADRSGRIFDTPVIALTYNASDEVTQVTEKASGQADFIYRDGSGERLVTTYGNPFDGNPWSQLFTFDDLTEIRNGSSGTEERCRLRANGKLVGELVRTSDTPTRSANFYLTDNVGSVIAEADGYGTVTARARRDPFGNLITDSIQPEIPWDPAGTNPDGSGRLGFADHPREANWGLVDMKARFYSPLLGRFASSDPVLARPLDRRSHNAFAYVRNNPVVAGDPLGMADDYNDDQNETAVAAAASMSYGNFSPADDFRKKRVATGLQSDFGGESSVDDGGGGATETGTIAATLTDDLMEYDSEGPRRKTKSAGSDSSYLSPAMSSSLIAGVFDSLGSIGKMAEAQARCASGPCDGVQTQLAQLAANTVSAGVQADSTFYLPGYGWATLGLNLQLGLPGNRSLFFVHPTGAPGVGFSPGLNLSANLAYGQGHWRDAFNNYNLSLTYPGYPSANMGVFTSPGWDGTNGWAGFSFGLGMSPPYTPPIGAVMNQTNYVPVMGPECVGSVCR